MKARTDKIRCLPEEDRRELKRLLAQCPVDFGAILALKLEKPWWAPAAAWEYRVRLGAPEGAIQGLRQLSHCIDWGEQPDHDTGARSEIVYEDAE